jgi:hypothetical protein
MGIRCSACRNAVKQHELREKLQRELPQSSAIDVWIVEKCSRKSIYIEVERTQLSTSVPYYYLIFVPVTFLFTILHSNQTLSLEPSHPATHHALHRLPHRSSTLQHRSRRLLFVTFPSLLPTPLPYLPLLTFYTAATDDSISSILSALAENNPEDAEAAASAMKIKLRRRAPADDDISSILAALEATSPDDAAAAKSAPSGRVQQRAPKDDLSSILAALEANSPDDAAAAKQGTTSSSVGSAKRQEDLASILAALQESSPDDAAAAKGVAGVGKRQDDVNAILAALEKESPEDAAAAKGSV